MTERIARMNRHSSNDQNETHTVVMTRATEGMAKSRRNRHEGNGHRRNRHRSIGIEGIAKFNNDEK